MSESRTHEFMSLLIANQHKIHAYILSMVPRISEYEEIMQDTLTEMWVKFNQYEAGTNFSAWGIQIAKFKILNFRRKNCKCKLQFNDHLFELLEAESKTVEKMMKVRLESLKECIKKLSMKELKLLRLRYYDNLTFQSIASLYGYSNQAICKALSLIHARLAKCIESSGI